MVSIMILDRVHQLHADYSSEVEGIFILNGNFSSLTGWESDKSRARAEEKTLLCEVASWEQFQFICSQIKQ